MSNVLIIPNPQKDKKDNIPELISEMDFISIRAKDFDTGFRIAKEENIDCVIVSMNKIDTLIEGKGSDFLHRIKRNESTYMIPVFGIVKETANDNDIKKALEKGMDNFIVCPVNNTRLRTEINTLVKLKKSTESIRKERKFIYTILDVVDSIIVVTDTNFNIIRCNNYTARFFCMEGTLVGRNFINMAFSNDNYYDNVNRLLEVFMESDSRMFRPEIILNKDDTEMRFKWTVTKESTPENENVIIFVGQDMSDTRRYETLIESLLAETKLQNMQLEEANALLEIKNDELLELNQLKTEYMSIVSHDLRSPISQIMGLAQLLLKSKKYTPTEKQKTLIEKILESAEFQLSLVSDILDITKVETGNMKLELELSDINKLIQKSVLSVEELAKNKGITISVKEDDNKYLVRMDKLKIQQVINNLLINALKFTRESGSIYIKTNVDGKNLSVSIEDTGIGIRQEHLKQIFKKFDKNRMNGTMGEKGTGLGLSICKKLIELHGGEMSVESTFGEGSTFTFKIPIT